MSVHKNTVELEKGKSFTAKFAKEAQRTQGKLGGPEILNNSKQIILPYITKGYLKNGDLEINCGGFGV